jgi:hypothetical protein
MKNSLVKLLALVVIEVILIGSYKIANGQNRNSNASGRQIKASDGVRAYGDLWVNDQSQPVPGIYTYQLWKGNPESGSFYQLVSANADMNQKFADATQYAFDHRGRMNDSALVVDGAPLDVINFAKQIAAFKESSNFEGDSLTQVAAITTAQDALDAAKEERGKHFFLTKEWRDANKKAKKARKNLDLANKNALEGISHRALLLAQATALLLQARADGYAVLTNVGIVPITQITANELPTRINKNAPSQGGQNGSNPFMVPNPNPQQNQQQPRRQATPRTGSRGGVWRR